MTAETVTPADVVQIPAAFSAATARRLAVAERTVYGTAGLAATMGPELGNPWVHFGVLSLGAGALARLWARSRSDDPGRLLMTAYRCLPALGLSGAYAAALATPGTAWWEYLAPG